jgi:hypothetical protein
LLPGVAVAPSPVFVSVYFKPSGISITWPVAAVDRALGMTAPRMASVKTMLAKRISIMSYPFLEDTRISAAGCDRPSQRLCCIGAADPGERTDRGSSFGHDPIGPEARETPAYCFQTWDRGGQAPPPGFFGEDDAVRNPGTGERCHEGGVVDQLRCERWRDRLAGARRAAWGRGVPENGRAAASDEQDKQIFQTAIPGRAWPRAGLSKY